MDRRAATRGDRRSKTAEPGKHGVSHSKGLLLRGISEWRILRHYTAWVWAADQARELGCVRMWECHLAESKCCLDHSHRRAEQFIDTCRNLDDSRVKSELLSHLAFAIVSSLKTWTHLAAAMQYAKT